MMTKWPQRGLLINQLIGPYSEPSVLSLEVLSPLGNDSCVSGSVPTSDYDMINRFLVGLNGAGVLYYFFCSKDGMLVEALNILLSGIWSL